MQNMSGLNSPPSPFPLPLEGERIKARGNRRNGRPRDIVFKAIFLAILFFSFAAFAQESQQKESADLASQPVIKEVHISRLVADPKLGPEDAGKAKLRDGSDPVSLAFDPNVFQTVSYARTKLEPKVQEMNQKAEEFFADRNKEQRDFFKKVRKEDLTSEARSEKLRKFQQEQLDKRQEFAIDQQVKLGKFVCDKDNEKIEDKEKKKDCKELAKNQKKTLQKQACMARHFPKQVCDAL